MTWGAERDRVVDPVCECELKFNIAEGGYDKGIPSFFPCSVTVAKKVKVIITGITLELAGLSDYYIPVSRGRETAVLHFGGTAPGSM
ncbi:MAG: hypothetical protein JSW59_06650 [Phycisphaerales bacterium]|nr:MAG: hypothetical protein JSW59_06650 [Phycisphaerales bacterium]